MSAAAAAIAAAPGSLAIIPQKRSRTRSSDREYDEKDRSVRGAIERPLGAMAVVTRIGKGKESEIIPFKKENFTEVVATFSWAFFGQVEDPIAEAKTYLEDLLERGCFKEEIGEFCLADSVDHPEQFNSRWKLKQRYYQIFSKVVIGKDLKVCLLTHEKTSLTWDQLFYGVTYAFENHIGHCRTMGREIANFALSYFVDRHPFDLDIKESQVTLVTRHKSLGEGGSALVFETIDWVNGIMVAQKSPRLKSAEDPQPEDSFYRKVQSEFLDEYETAQSLPNDPRIVKPYQYTQIGSDCFLLSRLCRLGDLFTFLDGDPAAVSLEKQINYVCQIWNFCRDLCLKQWFHPDIKPDNIVLLTPDRLGFIDWKGAIHRDRRVKFLERGTYEYYLLEQYTRMEEAWAKGNHALVVECMEARMLFNVATTIFLTCTNSFPREIPSGQFQEKETPIRTDLLRSFSQEFCEWLQDLLWDPLRPPTQWIKSWEVADKRFQELSKDPKGLLKKLRIEVISSDRRPEV